ncbi:hypothetical protein D3981_004199 [Escherichia coli]|nr:hypothetical protein [Escherichia coli]
MRKETAFRIRAFRKALELASSERSEECSHMPRWSTDLINFPRGSCDLASNSLGQYLMECDSGLYPCIIFMCGNITFRENENSTVNGHVIVALDGEYIDLTLDQFEEYPDYIPAEPIESCGTLGTLIKNIRTHEGEIKTRPVDLNGSEKLYAWLKNTANAVFAEDPEVKAWQQEMDEVIIRARGLFNWELTAQTCQEKEKHGNA